MHTPQHAYETLELLWGNYRLLSEQVDLEAMSLDDLTELEKKKVSERPFRIAAWLARQGYFIAAFSLWEFYARSLVQALSSQAKCSERSIVEEIADALRASGITFSNKDWFSRAYKLRNLIAHNGARVSDETSEKRFKECQRAFQNLEIWQRDGYINIKHKHVADLNSKIREFIEQTDKCRTVNR